MVSSGKYFPVSIIVEDEGAFKVGETYVVGESKSCMVRMTLSVATKGVWVWAPASCKSA